MDFKTVHIAFTLNGQPRALDIPGAASALQVIRDVIGLTGTKEGCGIGECGACTIEVDGKAVNSCLLLGAQLDGAEVLTVEGLAPEGGLHPLQAAFLDKHGVQCGFCTPGLLMSTHALLKENPHPDRAEVSKAIAGNLCRCTGYQQIFASIAEAVRRTSGEAGG
ncbi:MAG: (2Fe-2S)-binding protein [Desulfobacterales bacterium]|jgi:aerobic carbon-monoxide dehydrogenase small subunit